MSLEKESKEGLTRSEDMLEMDDWLTKWDCLDAVNSWRCCMMGAKLECPDVTSTSPVPCGYFLIRNLTPRP
jgi:hypothetical protein